MSGQAGSGVGGRIRAVTGRAIVALLLLTVGIGVSAPARAQVSDATLEVDVVDDSGIALPGVTVEARRPDTGFNRTSVTGNNGVARFTALAPASWDVKVTLAGFEPVSQAGIVLRVGQNQRIKATLRVGKTEAVEVTATVPLVDVYKTDSSTNIVPEQIRDLPVPDRKFENLAFIAPGVQRERGAFRFVTGGPVIGAGGNASQSSVIVNGVDFTDPALGLAKTRIAQDAIAEFRVIQNRFDTEVGGSAGGALSVVTRSGTNDLSGSLFGFYRADALRAKGKLETGEADFSRYQVGFTLGGPIVRDQTHFFGSFEQVNENNILPFRPGGAYKSLERDVDHPSRQSLAYVGIDQRAGESSRVTLRLDYERYREENFRVGGVADESYGQELQRNNYNGSLGFVSVLGGSSTNDLRVQAGHRKYFEPANSTGPAEWFTSGVTLQTGGNILGDLLGEGDAFEIRDTFYRQFTFAGTHDVKVGGSLQNVKDRSIIDTYATGLLLYSGDIRNTPTVYLYGVGSSDTEISTNRWGAYLQDDWRPISNLTLSLGVRYDLDTRGNNPNLVSGQVTSPRGKDTNNIQPRLGFSWDAKGNGAIVARGGWGIFTGRYLLVPAFQERSYDPVNGRALRTRVSILPALPIDPNNPTTTGFLLPTFDLAVIDNELEAPEARQASLGLTVRLANTGIFADVEGIYARGRKEIVIYDRNWRGNANPGRPDPRYGQINVYSNDGRSEYKALVLSVNGNLKGGHLITASATIGSKKNIEDDFSPEFPTGYPSDPADLEAEFSRGRSDERFRLVISGIARLPLGISAAPIFEYGSGQPWTRRYGYDFNGDGKTGDREPGVERFGEEGPRFTQLSLRLTKSFALGSFGELDVIAEAFNLFNTTNYDVTSVNNAKYLNGPTLTVQRDFVPNCLPVVGAPGCENQFGKYRATLSPREIQLGTRVRF